MKNSRELKKVDRKCTIARKSTISSYGLPIIGSHNIDIGCTCEKFSKRNSLFMVIMAVLRIYADYGYIILCVVLSWVMVQWLALQVIKARKKYKIEVICQLILHLCPRASTLEIVLFPSFHFE